MVIKLIDTFIGAQQTVADNRVTTEAC